MSLFSLLFRYKDKKSPDKLGNYPEKLHVPAFPERRYLWTSRILVICSIMSICVNIALTSIVLILPAQKSAGPSFFTVNEENNSLEAIQSAHKNVYFMDLLSEGYIHEYINMRHSIPYSSADLYYRWDTASKFYWYSSSRTYYDFINKIDNKQILNFIKMRMKRKIEIDYIKKLTDSFWIAQFKTYTTTQKMTTPDVIIWKAYLRIKYSAFQNYEDIEKDETDKMNYTQNPFGFKVIGYSANYAGKPEKSFSALETAKKVHENIEDVMK